MRRRRYVLLVCLNAALATPSEAMGEEYIGEGAAVRSPASPAESLQHLVVEEGLKVELVAHEPAVIDPIAIRFDEDGRMWVVELRDYPGGSGKEIAGRSRISVLEDKDTDGFYETATVFADGLRFPTGVQPWKGGVIVTMAGEVAYMKDTSRDGQADIVETWYTGFAEQNPQLRANDPRLALDNHIYIANGLRGGIIVDANNSDAQALSISGRDLRFDPMSRKFEAVTGVSQFGLSFDNYGNRFVCTNRNPAMHVVLENYHVERNPLLTLAKVSQDVAKAGESSRVYPITRAWTTSHLHAGQFTAACGITICRDDSLGDEFEGSVFTCEPTGHLVHREIMTPEGVSFISSPAEEGAEFFASRDAWCSPVDVEIGPDGAVYIVDMYRAVIEHPEFMPAELGQRSDLRAGDDRGRIYRVSSLSADFKAPPRLSTVSSDKLVENLDHRNAWWRDTAARLLLERQAKHLGPQLEQVVLVHPSPIARVHALRLLEGLDLLTEACVLGALEDPHPRVLEQAIVVAKDHVETSDRVRARIAELAQHEDARVRFQALVVSVALPRPPTYPTDGWELQAMLIGSGGRAGTVLAEMLSNTSVLEANVDESKQFIGDLAALAGASGERDQLICALEALLANERYRMVGLSALFSELERGGLGVESFHSQLDDSNRSRLDRTFEAARQIVEDHRQAPSLRCEAMDLLVHDQRSVDIIARLATDERVALVRRRAIAALSKTATLAPWRLVLRRFSHETPALQREILGGVFARPERVSLLLDEIEAGRIKANQLNITETNRLLQHHVASIQRRTQSLMAPATSADRQATFSKYRSAVSGRGDPERGRTVFRKHCTACHRIGDLGMNVAPDISDAREKSAEQLMTDILEPNRAIDSNYFSYTAITIDGIVHTGVLASETSTSITLQQAEGKSVTLSREEIDELRSDGVSLMPEGMERLIAPEEMGDLISFIKNWRYLDDSKMAQ